MNSPVKVQITSTPTACADGVKDARRDVAGWAAGRSKAKFGDQVEVKYYDLFDADRPSMPTAPVNGGVTLSGGKIAVPVIRRKIEEVAARDSSCIMTR